MKPMVYQWKANVRVPMDAQTAGEHLERLRQKHMGLTPKIVVEDAIKRTSPLHKCFDWDDRVAADKWREEQARYIIRGIAVVVGDSEEEEKKTLRAFVNISDEGSNLYTSIAHAMSDEELRAQLINRAYKELQDWRRRYDDLKEFAQVYAAINQLSAA